ncbi:MAG: hypothetical protein LAO55_16615 [Acidobacteriia bacterium]|nr:hypothetical protein [Terriglobia bacterium]
MRCVLILFAIAGLACSQALTEVAGAIAGGSVGGVAGKKVSDGITTVFGKVDRTTAKAAKNEQPTTAEKIKEQARTVLQVKPGGVVKDHSLVPPPPPRRVAVVPPPPPPPLPPPAAVRQPLPTLPPPRQATPDDLNALAGGTPRADVLKLGAPSSRITMFDNGHLVEIYHYQTRETSIGVVRLSDGSVSSVQVR